MPREKTMESSPAKKRAPRKRAAQAIEVAIPSFVDPQQRSALIASAAYFRAMNRGFAPGNELEDWLAAEAEVDAELMRKTGGSPPT